MSQVRYFRNGRTVGRWDSPSPGEPGTGPESRADSVNAPGAHQCRARWCFLPSPLASPASLGFLNRITTPRTAPVLKEGKEDLFLTREREIDTAK